MRTLSTLLMIFVFAGLMGQQADYYPVPEGLKNTAPLTRSDAMAFGQIEYLTLPESYAGRSLPDSIDNSAYPWFRPIFSQEVYPNCMQSTSIAYNFTYEINRLRDLPASDSNNQYTTHFAWNFFNGGNGWYGVNYLYTMEVLKNHGTPSVADYGGMYNGGGQRWMSGYEEWYNAMNNRIAGYYAIYVGDEKGLLTLKHWLNDHLDGSETGGVASFIACSPWGLEKLPPESPHSGKDVMTAWCNEPLHGMTIVGYNDSIRYDYNGDGKFTNDIDINGDDIIDMKDWEIGAVKFANSYGESFANDGFCFMMYKTLADDISGGGIWQNTVHVVEAKEKHDTRMTYKVSLEHNHREFIRVRAGISSDTNAMYPEHIHSFMIFNYQGGPHYMQGNDTTADHKTIEFGLDVSPLLTMAEPGRPYRFFLIVDEQDEDNLGTGQINYFSLMDYQDGLAEIACEEENVPLMENGSTLMSVVYTPDFDKVNITTEQLPVFEPGVPVEVQMQATGGQPPYQWNLDRNYVMNAIADGFPDTDQELLISDSYEDTLAVKVLEFSFPFYGVEYDTVMLSSSGYLYFDENMFFWSYLVDMGYFIRNNRVVAPFLYSEMFISPNYDNGLWYEGDDEKATFRWKTTMKSQPGGTEANFALTLYRNGNISFYYGDINFDGDFRWGAGVSDGDNLNFSLSASGRAGDIEAGSGVEFLARRLPAEMSIDREGLLQVVQNEASSISDVTVLVRDNTLVQAARSYQLTDGPEIWLELDKGNRISNGQEADFNLEFTNRGTSTLNNVTISLQCSHPQISVSDDQQQLTAVAPGQTIEVPAAFSCITGVDLNDSENVIFEVKATSGTQTYEKNVVFASSAPSLDIFDFSILNENNLLEPGHSELLKIVLVNKGSRESTLTNATLYCSAAGIDITDPEMDFGSIPSGGMGVAMAEVSASYNINFGHEIDFVLVTEDQEGLSRELELKFRVGKVPVCVIDLDPQRNSGPNIHGLLQQMDVESMYTNVFPTSLLNYQSVFICLGVQFSYHELSWIENQKMISYLDNGGNIYLESRVHWNMEDNYPVFDRFNIDTEAYPGLYEVLDGVDSTFTEGLAFRNTANQPFCYFRLKPVAPAFDILTGRTYPYIAAVAYDAGSYKTIGTLFELGSLVSSDTCQVESYMQEVLDFFGIVESSLGTAEYGMPSLKDKLHSYPNPFTNETYIAIELTESTLVQATVFDLRGRQVNEIQPAARMAKGHHSLRWDGRNQTGQALPGGIYVFRVRLGDQVISGKMILIR